MMISFVIEGPPIPQQRHRMNGKRTYDPCSKQKELFRIEALSQIGNIEPLEGPLRARIVFAMPRPKSHYRTGKYSNFLKESAPMYHIIKPDSDNLIKFCFDALSGYVFKDDCQIAVVETEKVYSGSPATAVSIFKLK